MPEAALARAPTIRPAKGGAEDAPSAAERAAARAATLAARFEAMPTDAVLAASIRQLFPGRIALVSSFGAESAVLLHLVAAVDPATPVIFVDTGRLFAATHKYRQTLVQRLGLTDVRIAGPDADLVAEADPALDLWSRDNDRCCAVRKVAPLAAALAGFDAWISGRKRHHGAARAALPLAEADGRLTKINPLAAWTADKLHDYAHAHDLPEHPMIANGFRSIGCVPCTDRVRPGEDARAGRWRGAEKTECGIHLGLAAFEADGSGI